MKIIVVEDEKKWNEKIVKTINQILIKENLEIEIISFYDYSKELEKIIKSKEINFYILDIELPTKNGTDIARIIRKEVNDWESLITITSVHNYKESFITKSWYILGYLLKLDDFENRLRDNILSAIEIFKVRGYINIKNRLIKDNILYVQKEKDSKYCLVKTLNDELRVRESLSQLQKELNLRKIKKYLLINEKNTISQLGNEIVFKNNIKIKI